MLNVDDDLWASASGRLLDAPTFFFFCVLRRFDCCVVKNWYEEK